ncbi:MAG: glycosyltransferase family 2 protein [Bacteroidales bacterium]|jgi:glycosyltransferase involved in cell wall biosynthesis|nr:glycosyltransferase family 2 protein [Bacteroidales bacterium]
MNLSVGLITHNEAYDLPRTLEAVKDIAGEIVIVDSGSTDRTVEIARSYRAKIYQEAWKGYGQQKNSVIDKCSGQWILLIDADEEVSAPLKERIGKIVEQKGGPAVYRVNFTSYCFGKQIRHGGWSDFYRVRLFRKGAGRYDHKQVHEQFITSCKTATLREYIRHYTYRDVDEYFHKFDRYSSKMAMQYFEAGKRKSTAGAMASSVFCFVKSYIFRLGFLDGFEGYFLSLLTACYTFVKYARLRELNESGKNETRISSPHH